jgi:hypothetical protein
MAGVFLNIDPPHPSPPGECVPLVRGEDTLAGWRGGWGVKILEDARHSSVLSVCKYFVGQTHSLFCDSPLLSGRDPPPPPPYEGSNVFSNPHGVGRLSGTRVWRRWLSRLRRCAPRWESIPPSATGRTSTGTGSWPSYSSRSSMHTRWGNRGKPRS